MSASAMQNEPVILRDDQDGVTYLTLNRPKAFNALSRAVLTEMERLLDEISLDRSTRVVVLSGHGAAFSAGHDMKEMAADRTETALTELFTHCSRVMVKLTRLPQPVIARIDGIAAAAGCQLVAACDMAVASDRSRFATSGIKYGLFCATPAVALRRVMPQKAALEMLFTGDFIDADEALRLGLVNRVVPSADLDHVVTDLAARILDKPYDVVALGKRAFYESAGMNLEDSYRHATEVIVQNALGADFAEGVAAFAEKRRPHWPA
ncbi:MAG TPA: enoyl-CoA hydratase [Geminicoccus sp.]|jgi:enoyl-CoA hydratase/carnithine racemase|uniref:enoyl-CoA hydratase n=1 Tax=Geminicoccus sp. TaxID=2024832 RepID=UPI002E34BFEA|nr:enoyl-CoA hydratase [Geminicoccus sp.]HEX2525207.1 enoyl-CoA hydratase [Geminicoccus sp.]